MDHPVTSVSSVAFLLQFMCNCSYLWTLSTWHKNDSETHLLPPSLRRQLLLPGVHVLGRLRRHPRLPRRPHQPRLQPLHVRGRRERVPGSGGRGGDYGSSLQPRRPPVAAGEFDSVQQQIKHPNRRQKLDQEISVWPRLIDIKSLTCYQTKSSHVT